ncbi:phosphotriesterase family protein [Rhodococcus sp. 5G237]
MPRASEKKSESVGNQVETARGPVPISTLGRALMHEHVFILNHDLLRGFPRSYGFDEDAEVSKAIKRLDALADAGIDTIVDLTVPGIGRHIPYVRRVAEACKINILVATGYYTFTTLPDFIRFRGKATGDLTSYLADLFVDDVVNGIGDTGVRPAMIKCASDEAGITPDVEIVLRAAARASLRTGLPITTHSHPASEGGLAQQDIFESEGVDLTNVVIGHSGDTADVDYLRRVMDRGSTVGLDRFGVDLNLTEKERVETVVTLCKEGYAEQIVLSHDAACYLDFVMPDPEKMRRLLPNWHFEHIPRRIVPSLLRAGVTEQQVDTMQIENPARILAGNASRSGHLAPSKEHNS